MTVPLRQSMAVGGYIARQKLAKRERFPLIVELEPLYQCNLECAGCGKIQHPDHILRQRMPVDRAIAAIEESGAPMVSIAGGEPLIHPEIDELARELIKRKRYIYLCTNAILMERKLDLFEPSRYFAWAVHMDGLRERHDESVCRDGVFDKAVAAIKAAKERGFRVTTNTTFFTHDSPDTVRQVLDFLNDELEVDAMMISPAYAYEKAPDQEHFLGVKQTHELFRAAFANGARKRWRLNHSPLFLDFLEGKVDYSCTAWGIPSYSIFGWQRPCYLMSDGYVETYKELVETTDWDKYGRGRDGILRAPIDPRARQLAPVAPEPALEAAPAAARRTAAAGARRAPDGLISSRRGRPAPGTARRGAPAQDARRERSAGYGSAAEGCQTRPRTAPASPRPDQARPPSESRAQFA
jgi:hopanoid biosynthesis associated radical SAM protein HpnH